MRPKGQLYGYWTFCGHANLRIDNSQTRQFADMTIRGLANSRTRHFVDMPIHELWMIRGKKFRGHAGPFMDKLFEVTALHVASSRAEIVKS